MELRNPVFIILIPFVLFLVFFLSKRKDAAYNEGSKIANTNYLKNSDYYKKKIKEYQLIKLLSVISFIVMVIFSTLLVSRPTKIEKKEISKYNRDIILCMDVSSSVDELNSELVDNLKDTVKKLNGERFGISIFNTSSVVLVPLTDDYDYINDVLDTIHQSIKLNTNNINYKDVDDYFYIRNYIRSGTLEGSKERGSSLIGDGLASCVYSFSHLDEERSRIIIFSTDNDLQGDPLLKLNEAAKVSKSKNIKVFGIGTKVMKDKNRSEFRDAVLLTGGKYYDHSKKNVDNIVSDIEKTSTSKLKSKTETKKYDVPEISFILLVISSIVFILSSRKVIS